MYEDKTTHRIHDRLLLLALHKLGLITALELLYFTDCISVCFATMISSN